MLQCLRGGVHSRLSSSENWICRDVPAVLLMMPNPLPRTMFDGRPKFTMLKMLNNSARNSSVPNLCVAAMSERRVFDHARYRNRGYAGSAKRVASQRAEAALIRSRAAGDVDRDVEERRVVRRPARNNLRERRDSSRNAASRPDPAGRVPPAPLPSAEFPNTRVNGDPVVSVVMFRNLPASGERSPSGPRKPMRSSGSN